MQTALTLKVRSHMSKKRSMPRAQRKKQKRLQRLAAGQLVGIGVIRIQTEVLQLPMPFTFNKIEEAS